MQNIDAKWRTPWLSGSEGPERYLTNLLDYAVDAAMETTGSDACAILLVDERRQTLTLKSCKGLHDTATSAVRLPKGKGASWRIVREKKSVALSDVTSDPDFILIPQAGEERYVSMMGVPILKDDDCIGVLFVEDSEKREYTHEDVKALEHVAEKYANSINAAWDFERLNEKTRSLSILNDLNHIVSATNNLREIVNHLLHFTTELTCARTRIIWLTDESNEVLTKHFPESTGDDEWMAPVRNGIVTHVARTHETVRIDDIHSANPFEGLDRVASTSVLCHPLVFEDRVKGVLLLADRVTGLGDYCVAFSGEEAQMVESLSQTAAQAISRVKVYQKLEKAVEDNQAKANELSILFQLGMAMQRTVSMDDLLRVILSCVTVGKGLGFNRAILFFLNETDGLLHGTMGLGPDTGDDANRIWSDINHEFGEQPDLVQWLLNRDPYEIENSSFNALAKSLTIPMDGKNIVAHAVNTKTATCVKNLRSLTEQDYDLISKLNCQEFAVAPLVARNMPIGAILVDNSFNRKPITESDLKLLVRFAAPAAWGIENIKLVERLSVVNKEMLEIDRNMAQIERLSTLGEVSAEMAHEIKNPLVTIGGFARRLLRKMPSSKAEVKYASIIVQEVERLERLLRNTLDVSRMAPVKKESADLNRLVREALDFYWRMLYEKSIQANYRLSPDLAPVFIDQAQIRQVVINLILNSIEAMSCDRHDTQKTITIETEPVKGDQEKALLKISDTGGGITELDFDNIFNPFFTTKPHGTGLGLPLCKKLIATHQGSMKIDNKLGVGVTFSITLPCCDLSKKLQ